MRMAAENDWRFPKNFDIWWNIAESNAKFFLGQTDRLQNLLQHAKKDPLQNGEKMEFADRLQLTPGSVLIYILLLTHGFPFIDISGTSFF